MRTITLSAAVILVVGVASSGLVVEASARPVGRRVTPAMNLPVPASLSTTALDDPTIAAIFDAANTADIETGQLAIKKGTTQDVRDFGEMLVRDHTAVRQMDRDLAKKLGIKLTPPADDQGARDHAAAMQSLRGLKGKAFDKAFLEHEVTFHKAVLDAVTTTLLPAIQNAELKDLVVKAAPAFQAHMMAAQNLESKLGN